MFNVRIVSLGQPRISRRGKPLTIKIFRISFSVYLLAFLLVFMQVSQGLAKEEIALSLRAKMLMEQAPRTPEAFLANFKEFLEHPETDIVDFVERITGVDRSYWIKNGNMWQKIPCTTPNNDLMISGYNQNSSTSDLSSKRICGNIEITNGKFEQLYLWSIKPTLTPAKIIAVYGKPKKVGIIHPWVEMGGPPFQVLYGQCQRPSERAIFLAN